MKRPLAAVVLLLLVVLGGGAAAAWWWTRRVPAPQVSVTPAQPQRQSSTPAGPGVTLMIDGGESSALPAGSPLVLTVSITGDAGAVPADVRFESDAGQPLAWRLEPLGTPETFSLEGGVNLKLLDFGVPPEEAARIGAGDHRIRAVLQRGPSAVSNVVTLTVTDGGSEAAARRAAAAARYYLRGAKYEEAHRSVLPIVEAGTADADVFTAFGDALAGLNREAEALAAYHEALALLQDQDESPDALLSRIQRVEERIR